MTWTHRPLDSLTVTSGFGSTFGGPNTRRPNHNGVDFRARTPLPVKAPLGGVVTLADRAGTSDESDGGGLEVVIRHDDGTRSGYAHLSEIRVVRGQRVEAGEVFALTGDTGRGTGPHLHMTARNAEGERVDPLELIPIRIELKDVIPVLLVVAGAVIVLELINPIGGPIV